MFFLSKSPTPFYVILWICIVKCEPRLCLEKKLCYVTRPLSSYMWCIVTKLLRSLALCLYRLLFFCQSSSLFSYRMFSPKSLSLSIYPKQPFCDFTDSSRTTHCQAHTFSYLCFPCVFKKGFLHVVCNWDELLHKGPTWCCLCDISTVNEREVSPICCLFWQFNA